MRRKTSRITLNISGEIYETRKQTLKRFPNSLLGNWEKRMAHYSVEYNQFYFQRSRLFFDAILFFYQSGGVLVCPPGLPFELFREECRFFELPEAAIERMQPAEMKENSEVDQTNDAQQSLRNRIWNILQNPQSSLPAFCYSIFSLVMITLSVITACLESMPMLQPSPGIFERNPWALTELSLNTWFLLELSLSLICAPELCSFIRKKMFWLDAVAILPYFMILSVSKEKTQSLGFLRIIRLVRIGRLFRLSKHSKKMKLVGRIMISAMGDFRTLLIVVMLITVLASSCMFFIEGEGRGGSDLTSIPMGLYWGVQTIFTVGYGDVTPTTLSGMLFAAAYMLIGPIMMSIPLLSIISKFGDEYEVEKNRI